MSITRKASLEAPRWMPMHWLVVLEDSSLLRCADSVTLFSIKLCPQEGAAGTGLT